MRQDGDLPGAIREIKQAIEADPRSTYLSAQLISFYIQNGDFEPARTRGEAALEGAPDDVDLRLVMGGLYFHLREYDLAAMQYEHVVRIDTGNLVAWLYIGTVRGIQKRYE